jgi:hypothetical protein
VFILPESAEQAARHFIGSLDEDRGPGLGARGATSVGWFAPS